MFKRFRTTASLAFASVGLFSVLSVSSAGQVPESKLKYDEMRGYIVRDVPCDEKLLALTFDDGPDPTETPLILDLLKQYGVKATFFVIGKKVRQQPDLSRREAAEGHELANHTYSHLILGRSNDQLIHQEIAEAQKAIEEVTGKKATLFRPPGGVYNDKVLDASKKEALLTVLWTWRQDTRDWARPGVGRIVRKVLRNVHNGDIILLHDFVNGRSQTADALRFIIPELSQRGYRFVTVSELIRHAISVW